MKNAEATNTTETVAVAEQGAQGALPKVTSKRAASQKKDVPKDQTVAKGKAAVPKQTKVLEMISRAKGATLAELMQATGWQAHSIRGFISGTLGKKLGLSVDSGKREDGERVYSLPK